MLEHGFLRQPSRPAAAMAQVGEQQLERGRGHVGHRLADRRQLGPDGGRGRGVVEADDGEVAGHMQPWRWATLITAAAISSLLAKIAVGGLRRDRAAARPRQGPSGR